MSEYCYRAVYMELYVVHCIVVAYYAQKHIILGIYKRSANGTEASPLKCHAQVYTLSAVHESAIMKIFKV